jgi:FlaA1/EpsC-like NDP-sugar epimerase
MIGLLLLKGRRPIVVGLHVVMVAACYYAAFLLRFNGGIDNSNWQIFIQTLPFVAGVELLAFIPYGLYRGLWRYIGVDDLRKMVEATLVASGVCFVLIEWILEVRGYPRSVYIINALLLIVVLGGARMGRRVYYELGSLEATARHVLIIGAGDAGELIVRDMLKNPIYNLQPIGFVDDDRTKVGRTIHNLPVLGTRADLPRVIETYQPDEILVAIYRADPRLLREIVRSLDSYKLPIKTLPSLRDMINGNVTADQIRNISLEDLLHRGPVGLDPQPLRRLIEGRRVLITGAGGSIGAELCRQVGKLNAGLLLLFERYENALYMIEGELHNGGACCPTVPLIGDVTDAERVRAVFDEFRPEVVIHAAAHKHVPLVQQNPCEAVKNNVRGTRIVAEAAAAYDAERFVLISTDKAVQPASVMGASKRVAELVVRLACLHSSTCFATVRFGNVLGSNGSVIPKFLEQINRGGPVTVTHPEVERFFMTIPEAVNLVLHSASLNESGALYVLDMGTPVKVLDMARHLIRLSGLVPDEDIHIEFIGLRPGEKLREELIDVGEKAERSSIPQLFKVSRPPLNNPDALSRELLRLEGLAGAGDQESLLQALASLVHGFRPPSALADEITPVESEAKLVASS